MTDCLNAQEVISAAYDGELGDGAALDAAKQHCRSCAECAAFVRTLAAIHRLPAPEMPEAALERVLEALRVQYDAEPETPAAVTPEPVVESAPLVASAAYEPPAEGRTGRLGRTPVWAPWAAAAAVLLVVAGIATTQGVRYLLQPSGGDATLGEGAVTDTELDERVSSPPALETVPEEDAAEVTSEAAYLLFDQEVFSLVGLAAAPVSGNQIGTVASSLDTGGPSLDHPVYAGSGPDRIVIPVEDGSALEFEPVVRRLRGTAYVLRSGDIGSFGQLPTLPPGIPEPAAADGSPVFIEAGADDLGVTIYIRPGTDPNVGFAVAPGTPPDDPAAGNSGWTWWEPRR